MKLKSLLLLTALSAGIQAGAQTYPWSTDTVYMGNGYANDVYYHMANGVVHSSPNNNWTLAFGTGILGRWVPVFANHVPGNVLVYSLHKDASGFPSDVTADTTAAQSKAFYNSTEKWENGAFNMNADPTNMFDYGWGQYDQTDHFVWGDSLFLVKTPGKKFQLWIEVFKSTPSDSLGWTFHMANLDGTNPSKKTIKTKNYLNNLFIYYSVPGDSFFVREPANNTWDILFTRYSQYVPTPPVTGYYPTTGVVSNTGVKVAELRKINADTAEYRGYPLDSMITAIGSDWKIPPMGPPTPSFQLDTVTYFVKSRNTSIYQLEFLYASQSAYGGKVALRKRMSVPLNVKTLSNSNTTLSVFPNPASADVNIMLDGVKEGNAQIVVNDVTGKIVLNKTIEMNKGFNAYQLNTASFAAGSYFITISNGSWKISDRLIVQH